MTEPLELRFWAKVERRGNGECWPWRGSSTAQGYGSIVDDGRLRRATHVSLELAGSPMPDGKPFACHTCDNPSCVNPAHLWWGTHADNMRDSVAKGRHAQGAKTHCPLGHPLSDDNLYITPGTNYRNCLKCKRASRDHYRSIRGYAAREKEIAARRIKNQSCKARAALEGNT